MYIYAFVYYSWRIRASGGPLDELNPQLTQTLSYTGPFQRSAEVPGPHDGHWRVPRADRAVHGQAHGAVGAAAGGEWADPSSTVK